MLKRRSYYAIGKSSPISDTCLLELIKDTIKHTPSAFNMQSQRVIVLLATQHDVFWDIVMEELRKKVVEDKFAPVKAKIESFKAGYGTILFFDDTAITQRFAKKFRSYEEHFSAWAEQGNGMLQYAVWTLLESEGFGANLQHYNPLVDERVKKQWKIPNSWRFIAQMPFGMPMEDPKEKSFECIENRMKIYL